jgi:hypothetical protein
VIIRILGEGQFDVADTAVDRLNELDSSLEAALEAGDEESFRTSLQALLDGVRQAGEPVAVDALVPSTLVLPYAEASLHEVRDLLSGDGLIPG